MTPRHQTPGVVVVGESLVDVVNRADGEVRSPGGSPFNVACALGRLGIPTELHTQLAEDPDGVALRAALAEAGVRVVAYPTSRTSRAIATLGGGGGAAYEFDVAWDVRAMEVGSRQVLHTGSIAAFLEPGSRAVRCLVEDHPDALLSFDPNVRPSLMPDRSRAVEVVDWFASRVHLVKLSDEDARWLWPGATLGEVRDRLLRRGTAMVAITRGGEGSTVSTATAHVEVAAPSATVVDTIGAGDAWMAGFLAALIDADLVAAGRAGTILADDLAAAGAVAAAAAALTVGVAGARTPDRVVLERELATPRP